MVHTEIDPLIKFCCQETTENTFAFVFFIYLFIFLASCIVKVTKKDVFIVAFIWLWCLTHADTEQVC